jgi:hypothetical protein
VAVKTGRTVQEVGIMRASVWRIYNVGAYDGDKEKETTDSLKVEFEEGTADSLGLEFNGICMSHENLDQVTCFFWFSAVFQAIEQVSHMHGMSKGFRKQ